MPCHAILGQMQVVGVIAEAEADPEASTHYKVSHRYD